jgi:hypothetical protein
MSMLNFTNQIKRIATFTLILCLSEYAYSQEIVTVDSIYENSAELLLSTNIIEFDSTQSVQVLKAKFKNWASIRFRNLNEVLVSETENQIVLNYIDNFIWDAGFGGNIKVGNYYKLIAQFKSGKMRIVIYDDGNTFIPSNSGAPAVAAHSTHYRNYFRTKTEYQNKGFNKMIYRRIRGFIDINRIFLNSMKEELKKPTEAVLKDDW